MSLFSWADLGQWDDIEKLQNHQEAICEYLGIGFKLVRKKILDEDGKPKLTLFGNEKFEDKLVAYKLSHSSHKEGKE